MEKYADSRSVYTRSQGGIMQAPVGGFAALTYGNSANPDRIRVGVVGCGGRGRGAIRDVLVHDANVEVTTLGDLRQDSIEQTLTSFRDMQVQGRALHGFNVTPDRCYTGLDAYRRVIDSDIDYVLLAAPPGWRPLHFEYAVNAGKHVFCEKPVGVDPAGLRRFRTAAQQSVQKGIGVLAGTQSRHDRSFQEGVRRIREGHIGDIMSVRVYRTGGSIGFRDRPQGMSDRDFWLMNWYHVDFLCGDCMVEIAVHQMDVVNWVLAGLPLRAYGMGGRQYHTDRGGNIYDHFAVEFEYPNDIRVTSLVRQIDRCDNRMGVDVIGTEGVATLGKIASFITGKHPWRSDATDKGTKAYELEHLDFITSLRNGNPLNESLQVADSTLSAILGREAAYTGKVITWEDIVSSDLDLMPPDMAAWNGTLGPVVKPGMKRSGKLNSY